MLMLGSATVPQVEQQPQQHRLPYLSAAALQLYQSQARVPVQMMRQEARKLMWHLCLTWRCSLASSWRHVLLMSRRLLPWLAQLLLPLLLHLLLLAQSSQAQSAPVVQQKSSLSALTAQAMHQWSIRGRLAAQALHL
jgi:hypothetical protein